jgi:hypothetical protein
MPAKAAGNAAPSAREDILDTVIALCEPEAYSPEEGCHFHLRFTKARALKGEVVKPLDVTLKDQGKGLWVWEYRLLEQSQREQIIEMLNEGITSPKAIHEEVGCTERYVRRIKAEWDELGNKAK